MSIDSALYARLSDNAGALYALVGTRIYPVLIPQDTFPAHTSAVSFQRITENRATAMGSDPGLVDARFQVDCWATDFDACRAVSEAVRGRLERWTNASSPVVQDTFIEDVTDTWEDDAQLYRAMLQIRTIYRE